MKKARALLVICFVLFRGVSSAAAFTHVESCAETPAPEICEPVNGCQPLAESGKYYLLTEDVEASGTCFPIQAGDFTFDLNGFSVRYAQAGSGNAFTNVGTGRENIVIGNGTLEGGRQPSSHAVDFWESYSDNIVLHDMDIYTAGLETEGIVFGYMNNLVLHDLNLVLDSEKANPCSHYSGHTRGILISDVGGKVEVYNNSIRGKVMLGIYISECGRWSAENPMLIHHNFIGIESPTVDGYAIAVLANAGKCSDGAAIFNNTIDMVNGRGIMIAGWNYPSDIGPGNIDVFLNDIYVQEGWDCEDNSAGRGIGLRVRYGANNLYVHHNYIAGSAGNGIVPYYDTDGNRVPELEQSRVLGANLTSIGENTIFEYNVFDVHTNDLSLYAHGVEVEGSPNIGDPNVEGDETPPIFRRNLFKSNDRPLQISAAQEGPHMAVFKGDQVIKVPDFESIWLGFWFWGAVGIHFTDVTGETGEGLPGLGFSTHNSIWDDITISWNLDVRVQDGGGNPVDGDVEISSGVITPMYGSTTGGHFSTTLMEKSYSGNGQPIETSYNPYTVTVTLDTLSRTQVTNLTGPTTLTFEFTEIANSVDVTPPILSGGRGMTLRSGTTEATISVQTNEPATCRYSSTPNLPFNDHPGIFSSTGGLDHSTLVSDLETGRINTYYVCCSDGANANTIDFPVDFAVAGGGNAGPSDYNPGPIPTITPTPDSEGSLPSEIDEPSDGPIGNPKQKGEAFNASQPEEILNAYNSFGCQAGSTDPFSLLPVVLVWLLGIVRRPI